jgi:hypothetical protein
MTVSRKISAIDAGTRHDHECFGGCEGFQA